MGHEEKWAGYGAVLCLAALLTIIALSVSSCGTRPSETELRIAVASNFKEPATELVKRFQERTGRNVTVTLGSTGKLYAQIRNGAPFAVFLAADAERPELLEKEIAAARGSRFTYAVGKLVLWSPDPKLVDNGGKVLESDFGKLAIANPKLAPYGAAAEEVLRKRGLWDKVERRLVRGENIGQTFQFVSTGNAELGFVALSQAKGRIGSLWEVPKELYTPIEQQAVLLSGDEGAREFLEFLKSEEAKELIREFGYDTR
ncbi:MAG: molybdate ABC transporter substrate-binding protein [Acidobacteriota bacterium]|nr:MAG: molybdate ABC transporter substrate-binding protein [Acidobacteriota bacterium]